MFLVDALQIVTSIATTVAVFLAWVQLRQGQRQATFTFEDSFASEYRQLSRSIPIGAHLGLELSDDEIQRNLSVFYHYFDLTNEQIFLRSLGRISQKTWDNWRSGIRANFKRPAFEAAWRKVAEHDGSLSELRRLISEQYQNDPATWAPTTTH